MASPPPLHTLGELRKSGFVSRPVRTEIRENLVARLRSGTPLFPGLHGYDETVVPAVENALLAGHDLVFLGERGQGKSRMIRGLVALLDEWLPIVDGSEMRDDPLKPVSARARQLVAEHGDEAPVRWLHRSERYVEKLATPDVSVADLVGDIDPMRVAEGRSLGDELTMHLGLVPRSNRGIFCVSELPDLAEKVQVALFDVMQERDIQVKGYAVRLPLDVFVVASANPEDYTSRGRIVTPLKDRFAAQVRTHYPATRALELEIVRAEARAPEVAGITLRMPQFMEAIAVEITHQARRSPDVSQASGVSVRASLASWETLGAAAIRRSLAVGETTAAPRISDLPAVRASLLGKLELEPSGREGSDHDVLDLLVKRAVRMVFEEVTAGMELGPVIAAFDQGWQVSVSAADPSRDALGGLAEIPRLAEVVQALVPDGSDAERASAVELVLEGLHLTSRLNKALRESASTYGKK